MPSSALLQALSSFLSLNPDVHLLPQGLLTYLTVLFAVSGPNLTLPSYGTLFIACPNFTLECNPYLLLQDYK